MKKKSVFRLTPVLFFLLFQNLSFTNAQTNVSGHITANTTWNSAGNPYLVNTVTVDAGVALNIEAGTVLKFKGSWESIDVYGTLKVNGTAQNRVLFTSLKDDSDGRDSNSDGNATSPQNGDWGAIWFRQGSTGNLINYTTLNYGGGSGTSAVINTYTNNLEIKNSSINRSSERAILIDRCSPDIHDCSFVNNETEGVYFYGLDTLKNFTLNNNSFTNNLTWAVLGDLLENKADITLTGNTSIGSAHNGFGVFGNVTDNVTFDDNPGFPFIITSGVNVRGAGKLNFTQDCVVKFIGCWDYIDVYGSLTTNGTLMHPVVFTSLHDDSYGGDTNGNGTSTSPAFGNWAGIWLRVESSGNVFNSTYFRYGGGCGTSAMINIFSSSTNLNSCKVDYSEERGIYIQDSSPDIQSCTFTGNQTDGLNFYGLDAVKDFSFSNNTFSGNINWAVLGDLKENKADITLNGNNSTGSAHNGFGMAGYIAANTILTGQTNFPFIVNGFVYVREQKKLTVNAGTGFKFNGCWDNINVYGSIEVNGTTTQSVYFTSLKDDMLGGDTNGDVSATSPIPGDWSAVWLQPGSSNIFNHTILNYGGGCGSSASLNIYSSSTELNTCNINYSQERGIYSETSSPYIHDCSFTGNQTEGVNFNGLGTSKNINFTKNIFNSNVNWAVIADIRENTVDITSTGCSSTGSAHNGFGINGFIAGNSVFTSESYFPFIVNGSVYIRELKKLTIKPGTGFKFNGCWDNLNVYGTLDANGTSANPIYFTSLKDDSFGGDSNSDGSATSPLAADWSGVWFQAGSTNSILNYSFIKYAGGCGSSANVNVFSSQLTIDNSLISKSDERGLYIEAANPVIRNSIISQNKTEGIFTTAKALPSLTNNQIKENTTYGIYNADASVDIDARNTWWGSATGPFHTTLNPSGQGNKVNDHVLFNPWKTTTSSVDFKSLETAKLGQFYPNPASGKVTIPFEIAQQGKVLLQVINTDGKTIRTLLDENRQPGIYKVEFNASDLVNGIYILRLRSNNLFSISPLVVVN